MAGAGVFAFARFARRRDWRLLLLACAVAATVPVQLSLLHKAHYMPWFTAPLIGGAVACLGALLLRHTAVPAIALTLGVLLIAPAAYSSTNWLAPVQSTFPAAGPRQAAGAGGVGVGGEHKSVDDALLRYVASHRPGTRWSVLTDAANTASPMILLGSNAARSEASAAPTRRSTGAAWRAWWPAGRRAMCCSAESSPRAAATAPPRRYSAPAPSCPRAPGYRAACRPSASSCSTALGASAGWKLRRGRKRPQAATESSRWNARANSSASRLAAQRGTAGSPSASRRSSTVPLVRAMLVLRTS